MSAPFRGTKTRMVGFLKGLFGKDSSSQLESTHDEVTYNYNEVTPVTGAQLKTPAPVSPINRAYVSGHTPAAAPAPQKNGPGLPTTGKITTAQPVAHKNGQGNGVSGNGHSNGNGNGHSNGQVVAPKSVIQMPTAASAPSAPIPIAIKHSNGNGNGNGNGVHHHPAPTLKPTTSPAAGKFINLSLAGLISALPQEIQARVIKKDFGDYTVLVTLETVLAQLATGVVKIPFGTIRESAPQFFAPGEDADPVMIILPLGEVLRQINPAQLAKPTHQVRLAAEDDVTSPFAEQGNNAKLEVKSTVPTRSITPEPFTPTPPRHGLGEIPKSTAPTANVTPPLRINLPLTPAPQPPSPATATPIAPTAPPAPAAPIPMPKAQSPAPSPAPAPAATPAPQLTGVPSLRMVAAPGESTAAPAITPAVTPPPAAVASPAPAQPNLTVALKSLLDTWPDAVKKEILEHSLLNVKVSLPLEPVAAQLKNGRVAFSWAMIRSWISPRPGSDTDHGALELELPLRIVAPLFIGLKSAEGGPAHRLTADEGIPDVFASVVKPTASAAVVPGPAAKAPPPPAPVVELAPLGMTPAAIVNRAAALKGVAGALIALPDGLVVASRLPAGLNGDSLAAFLPQIYAKFDACLKGLGMAGLNNLSFTAGKVPWRVFRTSTVFFAVFGRADELMPCDWLATLAGELEKK